MPAVTVSQAFEVALQHYQAGRLADSEALLGQILAVEPNHTGALHYLGLVALLTDRPQLAFELIGKAAANHPHDPALHFNLGDACRGLGRLEEAAVHYRHGLAIQPTAPQVHNNLGIVLGALQQTDEAIAEYRQAIAQHPEYAAAHNNLGISLTAKGRTDEAIAAFHAALRIQPDHVEALSNLGNTLRENGRVAEAVAAHTRAAELRPDYAAVHSNLASALRDAGRLEEATRACQRALELQPDFADALNNLGLALSAQGRTEEAIQAHRRAIEVDPSDPKAVNNLGAIFAEQSRLDEAVAAYHHALRLHPDYPPVYTNLGSVLRDLGEPEAALDAYRRALRLEPGHAGTHSNIVYMLHFLAGECDESIAREQQLWNEQIAEPLQRFVAPHPHDRDPGRRLRIGYVSPDLRNHVVGRNMVPLFEHHDHRQFEIFCYAAVPKPDHITEKIRQRTDHWRSTVGLADEALDAMIRQDSIDILVDLTQHTAGNRLPVFARQPAPVQVSFAGYPESTGLDSIEYRISDRWLEGDAPAPDRVCLIDSFWCYDPDAADLPVTDLPASRGAPFTFGSLNSFCKINEAVLRAWARILAQVKDSRLLLLAGFGRNRPRTVEFLEREGIAAERVEFVANCQRREYLERYHRVDVVLDPFPYNGHTTSLDALWMGVPVVSLAGKTRVSRGGLSILSNLGAPELVAYSEDDYVRLAVDLAHDLPRLVELRRTLRPKMESSVLMDAPNFARQIETAYRAMWQRWCKAERR